MLNVKGEGHAVHISLQMGTADGQREHLLPDVPNSFDFRHVGDVLFSVSGCRLGLPLSITRAHDCRVLHLINNINLL